METAQTAYLAGGCFWGMQHLLRHLPGVVKTRVGYCGGDLANPTYQHHGNHAETVEVIFQPAHLSFRSLLEYFFQIHDPCTPNRQGNDLGPSYRSAIFFTIDEQEKVALNTIAEIEASGLWPGKVVTQVEGANVFWEAEPEHQNYLLLNPHGYTCHYIRPSWKLPQKQSQFMWQDILKLAEHGNPAPAQRVELSLNEWREQLSPEQFEITRLKGTEPPHMSSECSAFEPGIYRCVCCQTPLFDAQAKYNSHSGWPSFTQALLPGLVAYHLDHSHGMKRIEATCNICDAHLGHVFPDGPHPSGLRYCINALALCKKG